MKEAIAFFAGLITMMVVWFYTDYFTHDSAYHRGYRQALKDYAEWAESEDKE